MHRLSAFAAVSMLAGLYLPLTANADTETLTYQGSVFTEAILGGNLTSAEQSIIPMNTGSVVLSTPLGNNLVNAMVIPEAWAFDSGTRFGAELDSSRIPFLGLIGNSATFLFSTDATGDITDWNISIDGGRLAGTNTFASESLTITRSGDTYAIGASTPACAVPPGVPPPTGCFGVSESNTAGGHWGATITAAAPEIDSSFAGSAFTLLAGCLAIVRARKRVAA
jgi:hypothetical protein